jgi:hypothetical protein
MNRFSRVVAAALTASFLVAAGSSAAQAAEPPVPIVESGIVSFPSIDDVVITPEPTGFTIAFDYAQPGDGWSPVRLGIYDGTSAEFPFDDSTYLDHWLGSNPGWESVVPFDEEWGDGIGDSGRVSKTYVQPRSRPITVMLFASASICDCQGGDRFVAGGTISALPASTPSLSATPVPSVTGTAKAGSTLTAVPGTWAPAPVTLAYQWSVAGTPIVGATRKAFLIPATAAGKAVTVTVTGSKTGYSPAKRTSAAVAIAAQQPLPTAPVPTVTGAAKVGSTLTAVPGTWGPAPVTLAYQWSVAGTPIVGATRKSFVIPATAAGKAVTVTVVGSKIGYVPVSRTSAPITGAAQPSLSLTPVPTVTGTAKVGSTLTAVPGTWGPAPVTLAYQWSVAGAPVVGATRKTFVLPSTASGKTVTVTVTGSKAGYAPVKRTSTAITAVRALR